MLSDFRNRVKDIVVVRGMLTPIFWEGKRWLAFDDGRPSFEMPDLHCFIHYSVAVRFCTEKNGGKKTYKVVGLGRVLKLLHGSSRKLLTDAYKKAFLGAILRIPASFCCPVATCIDSVERDDYFPLQWNMVLNPLTIIEIYYIFIVPIDIAGGKMRCPLTAFFLHAAFDTFENAIKEFKKAAETDVTGRSNYFLIGQIRHKKLEVDAKFEPQKLTGILLCRSSMSNGGGKLQVDQVHDVTEPFVFKAYFFARYKTRTNKLEFYDGALKRVCYGDAIEHIDIGYYMFG